MLLDIVRDLVAWACSDYEVISVYDNIFNKSYRKLVKFDEWDIARFMINSHWFVVKKNEPVMVRPPNNNDYNRWKWKIL